MHIQRIEFLDIAKGIGIILVVFGHTFNSAGMVSNYILAFHMPLFFFLSGFLYNEEKYKITDFIIKRAKQLLIPCLSFTLISVGIDLLFYHGRSLLILKNYLPGALWFLLVLFITEIIYAGICKLTLKLYSIRLVIIIVSAFTGVFLYKNQLNLPYSIITTFSAIFFYGLGHIIHTYLNTIPVPSKNVYRISLTILLLAFVFILVRFFNVRTQMVINQISPPVTGYFAAIAGIYGTVLFSAFIAEYKIKQGKNISIFLALKNGLNFLGKNTLVILCVHIIYREACNYYIHQYIESRFYRMLFLQVILWILIYFTILVFNKSKVLSYLLGKI